MTIGRIIRSCKLRAFTVFGMFKRGCRCADFVVTLRARTLQITVTIVATFYEHVKDFNEPTVDPSGGIKTRGSANKLRSRSKTSMELPVTGYVTNLTSLSASAYNLFGACRVARSGCSR